jgi:glycosyltransferase involved in cell wall biosynthesis
MKILHVIANLAPRYGGPSKACKDMCRLLAREGEDVTIFSTNMDFPIGRLAVPINTPVKQDGYSIWYFPVQFTPYMISLDMSRALNRHIKEFDLIHIHGLYRFPQAAAAYYARKYNIPFIISPHGSLDPFLFNRRKKNYYIKKIFEFFIDFPNMNKAAAMHFITEEEMRLTQPLHLKAPGIVFPLGLEIEEYSNLPPYGIFRARYKLENKKIILHFGRINFKKGLDLLVKAFAKVARIKEDVCLVLAGPDNEGYSKQVEKWLLDEGVREKAIFAGMLEGVDKLAVLRDADIFVLPSYTENFGIAVIEAMACGLPVVISDKVNIWREVQEAGAGLVTECDATQVANAILSLLNDHIARFRLSKAGKLFVREKYSWNSIARKILLVYKDIANKSIYNES